MRPWIGLRSKELVFIAARTVVLSRVVLLIDSGRKKYEHESRGEGLNTGQVIRCTMISRCFDSFVIRVGSSALQRDTTKEASKRVQYRLQWCALS